MPDIFRLAAGASLIVTVQGAWAQATPEPANADIVVTAQRRDQGLSRTPIAVTVVSADTLAKAQIVQANDLRQAAPGLSIRSGVGSEQLNFSLRGATQDPYSNVRPGVMPYVNDVQVGSQASSGAFYDLQSIQVLKGPQGTLFGRSATGGALLFTTQKPTKEFGGYVSGLYGNYGQAKGEAALNIPLVEDRLLFRVAGFYSRRDGFQYNIYDGRHIGGQRKYGVRPSLTAKFGPSVKNELVVDYYRSSGENTVGVISGLLPFTGSGTPFVPATLLYAGTATPGATLAGQCTLQAFAGLGACPPVLPAVSGFYQNYFSQPGRPNTGLEAQLGEQQRRGPYRVNVDGDNVVRTRNTVLTDTTTVDIGDARIKNIFGYTDVHYFMAIDADGTPYSISQESAEFGHGGMDQVYHAYSDELQLIGNTLGGKLDYVVGGYYSHETTPTRFRSGFFGVVFGGLTQNNVYTIANRTLAGYGQFTYHIGDGGLAATGGLRYTNERVGKRVLAGDTIRGALGDTPPPGYSYDQHHTFKNVSWTLGLQDQVTDSLMLYVTSRRGFRNGGFNGQSAPFVGDAVSGGDFYKAERVTDIEGGAKFNGFVAGVPVRIAGDFYYNWITDSQRAAFALVNGNIATLTVNVPSGRTYGFELETQFKPVRPLTVGGAFNYTNARFTNGQVSVLGLPQIYDQVPDTPRYNAQVFADLSLPVSGDIAVLLHGDLYYQSSTSTSPRSANYAGTRVPRYTIANFRVGLEDRKTGWSLTANLKNAFRKDYYVGGLQAGEIYQINTLVPGEPRTVTVEARVKF
jgi:iron complex outermembrane recepter protein